MPITTPTVAPTVAEFKADYPRFNTDNVADPAALQFSNDAMAYWLAMAVTIMNASRWGNLYYMGVELFMAHNLALEAWSEQGGSQTVPGIAKGAIAGTGAGDVSVSYDTASVLEADAGHWNYTTYGKRFIHLARLLGSGPLQVGPQGCSGGGAWQGLWTYNFPNPSS